MTGDGTVTARLTSEVIGGATNDKVGLMMRESTSAGSKPVNVTPDSSLVPGSHAYRPPPFFSTCSAVHRHVEPTRHPMNILIVDADPAASAALHDILAARPDYEIKTAASGFDAWMILTGFCDGFDVVFLDLALSDLPGIELLQRIRKAPALQTLPIIVYTSLNDRETVSRAIAIGIRHYLVKPASPEAVAAKLDEIRMKQPARKD